MAADPIEKPRGLLLSLERVKALTLLSKRTIYREMCYLRFPRPVKLSDRRVGWWESDINHWLKTRELA